MRVGTGYQGECASVGRNALRPGAVRISIAIVSSGGIQVATKGSVFATAVTGMAARSYGAATGRCLFLQYSLPSLQWPEMHAANLMTNE
jgi:hypothetical protein